MKNDAPKILEGERLVSRNVKQHFVWITRDKIQICLMTHMQSIESKGSWGLPFGIFFSTLATLLTADFRNVYKTSPDTWRAGFSIVCIATGIWTIRAYLRSRRAKTVEELICELIPEDGDQGSRP